MAIFSPAPSAGATEIYNEYPFFDPSQGPDVLDRMDAEANLLPTVLMSGTRSKGWAPTLENFTSQTRALPHDTQTQHLSAEDHSSLDVLLKATEDASKEMATLLKKGYELTGYFMYERHFQDAVGGIRTLLDQSQGETKQSAQTKKPFSFTGVMQKLKSRSNSANQQVQRPENSETYTGGMSTAKLREELLAACAKACTQGDCDTKALFKLRTTIRTQTSERSFGDDASTLHNPQDD